MLGYLEQTVATAIINALSAVGSAKPKYPFLSSTNSALLYVAYHLKGTRGIILLHVRKNSSVSACILLLCSSLDSFLRLWA